MAQFTVQCTAEQLEDIRVSLGNIAIGGVLKGWEVDVGDPEGNVAGCNIFVASPTNGAVAVGHIDHQRWQTLSVWSNAVFGNPDMLKASTVVSITVNG